MSSAFSKLIREEEPWENYRSLQNVNGMPVGALLPAAARQGFNAAYGPVFLDWYELRMLGDLDEEGGFGWREFFRNPNLTDEQVLEAKTSHIGKVSEAYGFRFDQNVTPNQLQFMVRRAQQDIAWARLSDPGDSAGKQLLAVGGGFLGSFSDPFTLGAGAVFGLATGPVTLAKGASATQRIAHMSQMTRLRDIARTAHMAGKNDLLFTMALEPLMFEGANQLGMSYTLVDTGINLGAGYGASTAFGTLAGIIRRGRIKHQLADLDLIAQETFFKNPIYSGDPEAKVDLNQEVGTMLFLRNPELFHRYLLRHKELGGIAGKSLDDMTLQDVTTLLLQLEETRLDDAPEVVDTMFTEQLKQFIDGRDYGLFAESILSGKVLSKVSEAGGVERSLRKIPRRAFPDRPVPPRRKGESPKDHIERVKALREAEEARKSPEQRHAESQQDLIREKIRRSYDDISIFLTNDEKKLYFNPRIVSEIRPIIHRFLTTHSEFDPETGKTIFSQDTPWGFMFFATLFEHARTVNDVPSQKIALGLRKSMEEFVNSLEPGVKITDNLWAANLSKNHTAFTAMIIHWVDNPALLHNVMQFLDAYSEAVSFTLRDVEDGALTTYSEHYGVSKTEAADMLKGDSPLGFHKEGVGDQSYFGSEHNVSGPLAIQKLLSEYVFGTRGEPSGLYAKELHLAEVRSGIEEVAARLNAVGPVHGGGDQKVALTLRNQTVARRELFDALRSGSNLASRSTNPLISRVAKLTRRLFGVETMVVNKDLAKILGLEGASFWGNPKNPRDGSLIFVTEPTTETPANLLTRVIYHEVWHTIIKRDPRLAGRIIQIISMNEELSKKVFLEMQQYDDAFQAQYGEGAQAARSKGLRYEEGFANVFAELVDTKEFWTVVGETDPSLGRQIARMLRERLELVKRFVTKPEHVDPEQFIIKAKEERRNVPRDLSNLDHLRKRLFDSNRKISEDVSSVISLLSRLVVDSKIAEKVDWDAYWDKQGIRRGREMLVERFFPTGRATVHTALQRMMEVAGEEDHAAMDISDPEFRYDPGKQTPDRILEGWMTYTLKEKDKGKFSETAGHVAGQPIHIGRRILNLMLNSRSKDMQTFANFVYDIVDIRDSIQTRINYIHSLLHTQEAPDGTIHGGQIGQERTRLSQRRKELMEMLEYEHTPEVSKPALIEELKDTTDSLNYVSGVVKSLQRTVEEAITERKAVTKRLEKLGYHNRDSGDFGPFSWSTHQINIEGAADFETSIAFRVDRRVRNYEYPSVQESRQELVELSDRYADRNTDLYSRDPELQQAMDNLRFYPYDLNLGKFISKADLDEIRTTTNTPKHLLPNGIDYVAYIPDVGKHNSEELLRYAHNMREVVLNAMYETKWLNDMYGDTRIRDHGLIDTDTGDWSIGLVDSEMDAVHMNIEATKYDARSSEYNRTVRAYELEEEAAAQKVAKMEAAIRAVRRREAIEARKKGKSTEEIDVSDLIPYTEEELNRAKIEQEEIQKTLRQYRIDNPDGLADLPDMAPDFFDQGPDVVLAPNDMLGASRTTSMESLVDSMDDPDFELSVVGNLRKNAQKVGADADAQAKEAINKLRKRNEQFADEGGRAENDGIIKKYNLRSLNLFDPEHQPIISRLLRLQERSELYELMESSPVDKKAFRDIMATDEGKIVYNVWNAFAPLLSYLDADRILLSPGSREFRLLLDKALGEARARSFGEFLNRRILVEKEIGLAPEGQHPQAQLAASVKAEITNLFNQQLYRELSNHNAKTEVLKIARMLSKTMAGVSDAQKLRMQMDNLRSLLDGIFRNEELSTTHKAGVNLDGLRRRYEVEFVQPVAETIRMYGLEKAFNRNEIAPQIMAVIAGKDSPSEGIQAVGEIIRNALKAQIARMNNLGAPIRWVEGFAGLHTNHNLGKIRGNRDSWEKFAIENFDWERIFAQQGLKNEWEVAVRNNSEMLMKKTFLSQAYDAILKDRENYMDFSQDPQFHGGLHSQLSAHRHIHFKNTDVAFEYDMQFGSGEPAHSIFALLARNADAIAMMEMFGPDGNRNFRLILDELGISNKEGWLDMVKVNQSMSAFQLLAGTLDNPVNLKVHELGTSARNLQNLTVLGLSGVSAITDIVSMVSTLKWMGMDIGLLDKNFWAHYAEGHRMVGAPDSDPKKLFLRAHGAAYLTTLRALSKKFGGNGAGRGFLFDITNKFFTVIGLERMTEASQYMMVDMASQYLGTLTPELVASNPQVQRMLRRYGLEDVRTLQKARIKLTGEEFFRIDPDLLWEIDPELASSYRLFLTETMAQGALEPDASSQTITRGGAWMSGGLISGTVHGEAFPLLTAYTPYMMSIVRRNYSRILNGYGTTGLKNILMDPTSTAMIHALSFMAGSLAMAYIASIIKDILRGKEPIHFGNLGPSQMLRLLDTSGLAGLYGPLLSTTFYGGNPATSMLSPVFGATERIGGARSVGGVFDAITQSTPGATMPLIGGDARRTMFSFMLGDAFGLQYESLTRARMKFYRERQGQTSIFEKALPSDPKEDTVQP